MTLPAGTRLGPYEIAGALGAGGMGEVYKARDTRLDRTVAIKVLPPHVAHDLQSRERFEHEARDVGALNHPNICTLHDIGHQDGIDFLVMERSPAVNGRPQEGRRSMITRRRLVLGAAAGFAVGCGRALSGIDALAFEQFEVTHTDAEWRKLLTADQYAVLRHEATEPPFSSALLHEKRRGTFACAGCALDNFSSTTKFDSGTGWPSFWAPIEKAIVATKDTSLGMVRTAVSCRRCGGHLGHVFDDGPKPTGLRYCINGVALTFKPLQP